MLPKNNKKLINAWSSYDWANSVYNLIITTAIFPIYYSASTKNAFKGEIVDFFGISIKNSVLYTYAISFSFLVIVVLSPILSGIADYTGAKKKFMKLFTYIGSAACMALYFFNGSNVEYGIICSVTASIGYAGSLVFYNAFLPEIATPDKMDKVSAKGFSMGYIGSVILLTFNLIFILNPDKFGFLNTTAATKFGFILVGIWWLGFSQFAFYFLKDNPVNKIVNINLLNYGLKELKSVFVFIKDMRIIKLFLLSFLIYSMGVQTVLLLAPLFAEQTIGLSADEMIIVVLIIQLLAVGGAQLFAFLSKIKGNGFSISTALVFWTAICLYGYFLKEKPAFYLLAGTLGIVMGGIQSISRSTYSKLIPEKNNDTASFFSFYDITEKVAIVIGTFSYGLIEHITGNVRYSLIFMVIFFIAGLLILKFSKISKIGITNKIVNN